MYKLTPKFQIQVIVVLIARPLHMYVSEMMAKIFDICGRAHCIADSLCDKVYA